MAAPQTAPVSVVNAFSGVGGSVAPGERVVVSGIGFAPEVAVEVWFGSLPAVVLAADPGQLTVQVPEDLAGMEQVRLEVRLRAG